MNIRVSNITSTSFVVLWDEVDDADWYSVRWRNRYHIGSARETTTSYNLTRLTPNRSYNVTVIAINTCGPGTSSDVFIAMTNASNVIKILSSSTSPTTSTMTLPTTSSFIQQSCTCSPTQSSTEQCGNLHVCMILYT